MNKQISDFTIEELEKTQLNAFKQREQAQITLQQTNAAINMIEEELRKKYQVTPITPVPSVPSNKEEKKE